MGWTTTTTFDATRHDPLTVTDQTGNVTEAVYDLFGRVIQVWNADHTRSAYPSLPSAAYAYTISNTGPTSVKSTTITAAGTTLVSYTLYDGLLQQRQTQTPAEGGGSDVTDTFYDESGRPYDSLNNWFSGSNPSATLLVSTAQVPSETRTIYDGAGRKTADVLLSGGTELWRTSYSYGGDHVSVTPPSGGTPTSTYTDARGRTTSLLRFHGSTASGAADTTSYTYWPAGQMASMSDAATNKWTWTYDLLGQVTDSHSPDQGNTHNDYDASGRLIDTIDARGSQLDYDYDALDRKTNEYSDQAGTKTKLVHWDYDSTPISSPVANSVAKGELTDSIRYAAGTSFTQAVTKYDAMGRTAGTTLTVPAGYGALSTTYSYAMTYGPDGSQIGQVEPAVGGLPGESLILGYDTYNKPVGLRTINGTSYLTGTTYDSFGRLAQTTQVNGAATMIRTYSYADGSNRLSRLLTQRQTSTDAVISDRNYSYSDAGDVTRVADNTPATGNDVQCFNYDYNEEVTDAWTPSSGSCTDAKDDGALGGPAPYWQTYAYDVTGSRTKIVRHATTTGGADLTDLYHYPTPGPGAARPHAVSSVSHSTGAPDSVYGYDASGNTHTRLGQTLTYDEEGHLKTSEVGGTAQQNIYDADGNLLLQTDQGGAATLYLPDGQVSITSTSAASASGVRTYTAPTGQQVAERTTVAGVAGTKLGLLDTNLNGTVTASLDNSTNSPLRRYFDPFGGSRSVGINWIDSNTFLNKPSNATTGTIHLGARDYDPTLGVFLSVDPVFSATDPLQDNGYSYSHNNPVGTSDPTGLHQACDDGCHGDDGARPAGATHGIVAPPVVFTAAELWANCCAGSSPPEPAKPHRSFFQNWLSGFAGVGKPQVQAAFQFGGGAQTAYNFQHGIPATEGGAAQAGVNEIYDCDQVLVCASGALSTGLVGAGTSGAETGFASLLERLLAKDVASGTSGVDLSEGLTLANQTKTKAAALAEFDMEKTAEQKAVNNISNRTFSALQDFSTFQATTGVARTDLSPALNLAPSSPSTSLAGAALLALLARALK